MTSISICIIQTKYVDADVQKGHAVHQKEMSINGCTRIGVL